MHRTRPIVHGNMVVRRHYVNGAMTAPDRHITDTLTITLNPALDIATSCDTLLPNHKLRCDHAERFPGGGGINVARVIQRLGGGSRPHFHWHSQQACCIGSCRAHICRDNGYILRRYCPPTSNKALVICPSEHTRTASISTSNTLSLLMTAC